MKDGLISVKGKVNGVIVHIKAKAAMTADFTKGKALETYAHMKKVVEGLPITGKITNGVAVVKGKANDVVVYVKNGYMHAVSRVGDTTVYIRAKIVTVRGTVKVKVLEAYRGAEALAHAIVDYVLGVVDMTKAKAGDKPVAASAMGGAMLLGAGGGAAGGVAGGLAGATCGVPLAVFTLGLSIPICAVVGGGAGVCVGATAGGAAGAVGGGAAGYGYGHRAQIKNGMDGALTKVGSCQDKVKAITTSSVEHVKLRLFSGTKKSV